MGGAGVGKKTVTFGGSQDSLYSEISQTTSQYSDTEDVTSAVSTTDQYSSSSDDVRRSPHSRSVFTNHSLS